MMTHKRSFQHQCAIRQMAFCLGKDEVGGSNPPSSSKKHRKLRFSVLFCCKTLKEVWVKMWVNRLTHTVTHTGKCSERAKEERTEAVILKGLFFVSPRSCILRQDMLQYLPLILSASYEAV